MDKKSKWIEILGGFLGISLVVLIGWMNFIGIIVGVVVAWLFNTKILKLDGNPMKLAINIHIVYECTFIISVILAFIYDFNGYIVIFDVIIIGIGITWLVKKPSLPPTLLLSVYQVIGIYSNCVNLINYPERYQALIMHLLLRISAVIALYKGYSQLKKQRTISE